MHPRYLLLLLPVCFLAQPSLAGEAHFYSGRGSWTSTDCMRPTAPPVDTSETAALNVAIQRVNDYISQVEAYAACLKQEAEADMTAVSNIIRDETVRLQNEAIREAEELRGRVSRPRS